MEKISKFGLPKHNRCVIQMPRPLKVLSAQTQKDQICVWILFDGNDPSWEPREFRLVGSELPVGDASSGLYVGTCQMADMTTLHVFDMGPVSGRSWYTQKQKQGEMIPV